MSLVGHHIGRYRILEQVGSGGMSVVYKGLDTALDREVAVKVLHPHLAGKEDSRKRLAREAKAVAKLQHPNILEIFDFVAADSENAYLVTEYIRGQTLRQYAEKDAFHPPEIAAMVIHEVAAALAHAHEAGIIHRDLKPENVMVRDDGVVKLMDFGIAKILDREDRMTMTGALVGSPAHMAPEIIEGHEIGPEADVFSLGTMLYFFATARLPFFGPNATATLKKILDGSYEDPRKLAPAICDELAEIIATCLARQPAARYPHARNLREALSDYLSSVGFPRASDELGWFFVDPAAYRVEMERRLIDNRLQRAQELLREKRPARALACLNQVLALDSTNARARQILSDTNRKRRRRQVARRWTMVALSGCAVLALCTFAFLARHRIAQLASKPMGDLKAEARSKSAISAERQAAASADPVPERPHAEESRPSASTPMAAGPAKPSRANKKTPSEVKLTLLFRPYAYAQVDGGERRPPMPVHEFLVTPGPHRLVYGCSFCEEESRTVEAKADAEPVRLLVQAKASSLIFRYQPPDALITVGAETRSATDAQGSPFQISFPKGTTQQQVTYEVARPGFKSRREMVSLMPGESKILEGSLEPE